eukprot:scaffold106216_cov29-Tisochrysis_lutea.AAC.1
MRETAVPEAVAAAKYTLEAQDRAHGVPQVRVVRQPPPTDLLHVHPRLDQVERVEEGGDEEAGPRTGEHVRG